MLIRFRYRTVLVGESHPDSNFEMYSVLLGLNLERIPVRNRVKLTAAVQTQVQYRARAAF